MRADLEKKKNEGKRNNFKGNYNSYSFPVAKDIEIEMEIEITNKCLIKSKSKR